MGAQQGVTALRVVLDTNVLLSALAFQNSALAVLRIHWQSGRFVPLASRQTVSELVRVLAYPRFQLDEAGCQRLLATYLPWCETVAYTTAPVVPACRDPADIPFLELAKAAKADALVTADRDLLALAKDFDVPIVDPSAFRERLR